MAAPRAVLQPAPALEAALQVDFDDDDEEVDFVVAPAVQQPKVPRAGRPLAATPPLSQPQRKPKAAVRILLVSMLKLISLCVIRVRILLLV